MSFVKAANIKDFRLEEMKMVTVANKDILIAKIDNNFYAVNNKCPHMGGSLVDGTLDGSIVTCPRHGATFDLKTGECTGELKVLFIKKKASNLKTYPLQIIDNTIFIDID